MAPISAASDGNNSLEIQSGHIAQTSSENNPLTRLEDSSDHQSTSYDCHTSIEIENENNFYFMDENDDEGIYDSEVADTAPEVVFF